MLPGDGVWVEATLIPPDGDADPIDGFVHLAVTDDGGYEVGEWRDAMTSPPRGLSLPAGWALSTSLPIDLPGC